jgi:large subunit ribosomal protein L22
MAGAKTNEREGTRAVLRYARVSPYKVREVLDLIRNRPIGEAEDMLRFSERDAAIVVAKVLHSAVANAENNDQQDAEDLYVSACFADEGTTIKRWRPRARGRATRIRKRTCHVTIIVSRLPEEQLERLRSRRQAEQAARRARRVAGARRSERGRAGRRQRQAARAAATATAPGADDEAAVDDEEAGIADEETGLHEDEAAVDEDEAGIADEEQDEDAEAGAEVEDDEDLLDRADAAAAEAEAANGEASDAEDGEPADEEKGE